MADGFPIQVENQVVECKSESDRQAVAAAAEIIREGGARGCPGSQIAALRETCTEYELHALAQQLKYFQDRAHLEPRQPR